MYVYGVGMHSLRIPAAGCLAALACAALSGCVGEATEEPTQASSPTVTSTSPFASNDEALEAAVAAFQRYVDVDSQLSDPSVDLGRIHEVATGVAAEQETIDAQSLRDKGMTQTGIATFDLPVYNYGEIDAAGLIKVKTFICVDISQTRLFASDGTDLTSPDRATRMDWKVDFVSASPGSKELLVERTEQWASTGRCSS